MTSSIERRIRALEAAMLPNEATLTMLIAASWGEAHAIKWLNRCDPKSRLFRLIQEAASAYVPQTLEEEMAMALAAAPIEDFHRC